MKTIKFRGKRLANGEWCYGSLLVWADGECTILEKSDSSNAVWKREIDPDTVGQFTGLTDAYGKEVYEGDLLRTPEQDIMLVEWQDAKIITKCVRPHNPHNVNSLTYAYPVSVVIGNIHDNPE